ncbi:TPA: TetR family transcriptional regulator [Klebsiella michiganensis]|nr:TetR family transcriptional regulator [Klebsiella michiganensis]
MVRRTKIAAERTRKQILDAAEQCFRDIGVTRTTLDMIAEKAGCTRGAIYWHFTEKKDILKQLIERTPLFLFSEITEASLKKSPLASLRHCLLQALEDLKNNYHLRNIIEVAVFHNEYSEDSISRFIFDKCGPVKLFRLLESICTKGKLQGEFKINISSGTLTVLIFSVFTGAVKTNILMAEKNSVLDEGKKALNLIFDIAIGTKVECNENT